MMQNRMENTRINTEQNGVGVTTRAERFDVSGRCPSVGLHLGAVSNWHALDPYEYGSLQKIGVLFLGSLYEGSNSFESMLSGPYFWKLP